MPKIALGITGLLETLGRDYEIEEPYWGPSEQSINKNRCQSSDFYRLMTEIGENR